MEVVGVQCSQHLQVLILFVRLLRPFKLVFLILVEHFPLQWFRQTDMLVMVNALYVYILYGRYYGKCTLVHAAYTS